MKKVKYRIAWLLHGNPGGQDKQLWEDGDFADGFVKYLNNQYSHQGYKYFVMTEHI